MANVGSVLVACLAILLGIGLGAAGIQIMLAAGDFASGSSESSSGLLGLGGSSSSEASVPTSPWIGLVLALVGAGALLFGLRAMFVAVEGKQA